MIFPFIEPQREAQPLPLYKDVKFKNGTPVFKNGEPVFVEGHEAVMSWAYCALSTERFKHNIYTHDYANEINSLIGKPFTNSTKTAEAKRYIEECLLQSPYIKSVDNISVEFDDGLLSVSCEINTIYGKGAQINV